MRVAGDGGIERDEPLAGIHHQHHNIGHADIAAGHHHTELLRHQLGLAFAADAGRIHEDVIDAILAHGFVH